MSLNNYENYKFKSVKMSRSSEFLQDPMILKLRSSYLSLSALKILNCISCYFSGLNYANEVKSNFSFSALTFKKVLTLHGGYL